ncbi:SDR family NAD(P)-dependent oxidoreductase [Paraburkholderia hospita]|uniref:SDR family NAD(P)-dependent oxidoreductase n=1 Tax=Paraburkholderia hospita TaxID=169430 RepID=UPI000B34428D|nr:SDR family oxidoreductase [Paraburkholderia hospita]OUL72763.1 short-chain dehydrogenase [Paraburkholderia hospita]
MKRLEQKVAIITGAGTGIGEATARRFAEENAKVAVFDVVKAAGEATAVRIKEAGGHAIFVAVDVTDEAQVRAGVEEVVDRLGSPDILVNNAAITGVNKLAHEVSVDEWDKVFAVNVRGSFLCTKHVVPHMMQKRAGAIVNFSSIYALIGNNDIPPYHATKGAILAMTKTDALCYAEYGIRVNAVHPGSTKTPLFMKAGETYPGGLEVYLDMMKRLHPLRLGEPIDVANCVLFLASDEAGFVTGTSLVCDGGYTAQ